MKWGGVSCKIGKMTENKISPQKRFSSGSDTIPKTMIKAVRNPLRFINLLWRRFFPFGIVPKDDTAYRIGSWNYGKLPRVKITEIFPGIEDSNVTIVKAFDRDTYMSPDFHELIYLSAVIKFVNAKNILEIGTFDGKTTLNIAENTADDAMITTVDLPEDWDGKMEIKIPQIYNNVTDSSITGIMFKKSRKHSKKITSVYCDSAKLEFDKLNAPFDLVFIDGCHYYDYVKTDSENAFKHTTPEGVIIWHDYGMIKDISRAVDEFSKKMDIKVIKGTRLAIGKKK